MPPYTRGGNANAALLDELMGKERNVHPRDRRGLVRSFRDHDVCRAFLAGFCMHEMFTHTKADVGPCARRHDERLRDEYRASPDFGRLGYEASLLRDAERKVDAMDATIRRGIERLARQHDAELADALRLVPVDAARVSAFDQRLRELAAQSEALGERGDVAGADALMRVIDETKSEKQALLDARQAAAEQRVRERQMLCCEVCGAFVLANDTADRQRSHLEGKLHVGFTTLREYIKEQRALRAKRRAAEQLLAAEATKPADAANDAATADADGADADADADADAGATATATATATAATATDVGEKSAESSETAATAAAVSGFINEARMRMIESSASSSSSSSSSSRDRRDRDYSRREPREHDDRKRRRDR